jgi:predicted aspartyl protease
MFASTMPPRKSPEGKVKAPAGRPIAMGVTTLVVGVANLANPDVSENLEFTVDSGAVYSVVPAGVLRKLGIQPLKRETFRLADGRHITRQKGGALFKFRNFIGVADAVFGEKGDATLLGALTLEALGLALDPIKRELRSMQLFL